MGSKIDIDDAPRLSVEEAWHLWQDDKAVFVDTRPRFAYEQGHIPGAISMPFEELPRRLAELPRDRMLVFY